MRIWAGWRLAGFALLAYSVALTSHAPSAVSVYCEHFCISRASVFLCYYVFTAAIMHVATRKFRVRTIIR